MTPYEYFLAIKDYCEGDTKETIAEINNLILEIVDNPNEFIEKLSNELEEYYSSKDICPLCGENLTTIESHEEDRGEYLGQPVAETMNIIGCSNSNCTYVKN